MKLKNTVIVVELEIDDNVLAQVRELKSHHEDKKAVIEECEKSIRKNFPEIEIFQVGPDYIVTDQAMYLAFFEDEFEIV